MDNPWSNEAFHTAGEINPFENCPVDVENDTAGDWCMRMISASFGGKQVHGVSFSASCEVLAKTDYGFAQKHAVGYVKWDAKENMSPNIDGDPELQMNPNSKFRGIKTSNHMAMLESQLSWDSSSKSRLRNSIYIAAGMIAHGHDPAEALSVSEAILGEEIDPDILSTAAVPLSHLKREAVFSAKGSNQIFGEVCRNQRVLWDDTALKEHVVPEDAAVDWGRITTVARFIGCINTKYDPRFKYVAAVRGIPYVLIKNHWAWVSPKDYDILDSDAPLPGLIKHKVVPSVAEAQAGHVDDVRERIHRMVGTIQNYTDDPKPAQLLKVLDTLPRPRKRRHIAITPGTEVIDTVVQHRATPESAADLILNRPTSHKAYLAAATSVVRASAVGKQACATITKGVRAWDTDGLKQHVKVVADIALAPQVWQTAVYALTRSLGNPHAARFRLARYKRSITGCSTNLIDKVGINSSIIETFTPTAVKIAKQVLIPTSFHLEPPPLIANPETALYGQFNLQVLTAARDYLASVRDLWSARYRDNATLYSPKGAMPDQKLTTCYGCASVAFNHLEPSDLLCVATDYVPRLKTPISYIASALKNYVRKRSLHRYKIDVQENESVREYASRMDNLLRPDVPFVTVVDFVTEKIAMVAADFGQGKDAMEIEPTALTGAGGNEATEQTEDVEALMRMIEEAQRDVSEAIPDRVSFSAVISTWPSHISKSFIASTHNFTTIEEMFEEYGERMAYDEENPVTQAVLEAYEDSMAADEDMQRVV